MNNQPAKPDAPVLQLTLRPKEVAQALSFSERKLWELTNLGHIKHFHVGRAVLYPVDKIRQWMKDQMKKKGNK